MLAVRRRTPAVTVERVTDDRMAEGRHVNADLVGPSGVEARLEIRLGLRCLTDLEEYVARER